ncbi:permease prefix domain 1-containing protein [Dehalobacter sp. DCM]|uniref:permease prefix domain 1-containing protein n=1 Tax=Dehalobacter sp. DCM TaxID=2907827 RepID=UPI0030813A51|nr:permease prefix domain 1-containing protein [Dehalobacter sp. DCM]
MNELSAYVDHLFKKHGNSRNVIELKEEILANLEAKQMDLINQGYDQETAIKRAKESIISVDNLIEGNKAVHKTQWQIEILQWALIYLIIAWIFTIPLGIFSLGRLTAMLLFICVFLVGIRYLIMLSNTRKKHVDKIATINAFAISKLRNTVWIIWGMLMAVSILATTGIYFGSAIWFSRHIDLDGPYDFAVMVFRYLLPFVTLVVPLIINKAYRLITKYEAGDINES